MPKEQKDILLVPMSDLHSGSNNALFVNRFWQGRNGVNHTPTSRQEAIYRHFEKIGREIRKARKGKNLVVVHDGDAIEGVHHNNVDVATRNVSEQCDLHVEIMAEFKRMVDWQRGDKLYYVAGTETHTGETENGLADAVGAQQYPDGWYVCDHLELVLHGQPIWFVHHGPGAGKGANEGNGVRNWLRDAYWDAKKENKTPPAMIITGHVHQPTYNTYVVNDNGQYKTVHGVICPSWQAKTRYAHQKAPLAVNKIGSVIIEIKADGEIKTPKFLIQETDSLQSVTV